MGEAEKHIPGSHLSDCPEGGSSKGNKKEGLSALVGKNQLIFSVWFVFTGLASMQFYYQPFGVAIIHYLTWDEVLFSFFGKLSNESFKVAWVFLFLAFLFGVQLVITSLLKVSIPKIDQVLKDRNPAIILVCFGLPGTHLLIALKYEWANISVDYYLPIIFVVGVLTLLMIRKASRIEVTLKPMLYWSVFFIYGSFMMFFSSYRKATDIKKADLVLNKVTNEWFYSPMDSTSNALSDTIFYKREDHLIDQPHYLFIGQTKGYLLYYDSIGSISQVLEKSTGIVQTIKANK